MPNEPRFAETMLVDLRRMLGSVDARLASLTDQDTPELRSKLVDLRHVLANTIMQMEFDWPE